MKIINENGQDDNYIFFVVEEKKSYDDLVEAITACFPESEHEGMRYKSIIKHHATHPELVYTTEGIQFQIETDKKMFTILFQKVQ